MGLSKTALFVGLICLGLGTACSAAENNVLSKALAANADEAKVILNQFCYNALIDATKTMIQNSGLEDGKKEFLAKQEFKSVVAKEYKLIFGKEGDVSYVVECPVDIYMNTRNFILSQYEKGWIESIWSGHQGKNVKLETASFLTFESPLNKEESRYPRVLLAKGYTVPKDRAIHKEVISTQALIATERFNSFNENAKYKSECPADCIGKTESECSKPMFCYYEIVRTIVDITHYKVKADEAPVHTVTVAELTNEIPPVEVVQESASVPNGDKPTGAKSSPIGAIVGSIGGLLLLAAIIGAVLHFRKGNKGDAGVDLEAGSNQIDVDAERQVIEQNGTDIHKENSAWAIESKSEHANELSAVDEDANELSAIEDSMA